MKPLWVFPLIPIILLTLGCSKEEEAPPEMGVSSKNKPANKPEKTTNPQVIPNLPVSKQRQWTYLTGRPTDLDRVYLNRPINILTNAFGMPSGTQAHGNVGIWFYDRMKVDYQGTNYSKVNVIIQQGHVVKITIDPRSIQKGDPPGAQKDAGGSSPIKGDIDPTTGLPFKN